LKFSTVKNVLRNLVLAALGFCGLPLAAQQVQHLTITQPGGMPGFPVMTGIIQLSNGVQLTWSGPSGYYQVFQKSNSLNAPWIALGTSTNLANTATITKLYSNAFFRVAGPAPKYAGDKSCIECHNNICRYVTNTAHASAFSNPAFKALGGQTNASCLACHTVGYGLPTGFVSALATPQLANVQCENCHGPAANHAANENDPTVRPRVDIAATVCGGCHSASHTTFDNAPTFEEWSSSGHAAVVPDVLQSMNASTNSIRSCGVCHSGSARLAMIGGKNPAITLTKDYNVPITCAVCHDPHRTNGSPDQLRNPVSSTNAFRLTGADTATVTAFTNKYYANLNINICGQCHNDRGTAWTDTARAPHHSVQYNFLLGSVGELLAGPATFNPGSHAGLPSSAIYSISGQFYLTNQCANCHMQADSSDADNHTFAVTSDTVCFNCHVTPPALLEQFFLTPAISNSVSTLITALNRWVATKAPAVLRTNGVVGWEYTTPGGLTWQTNSAGQVIGWSLDNPVNFTGPNTAGQALIPDQVKRARFNLYLVLNDGSFGVHNPTLALNLLNAAEIWMVQVLQ
jgi:Cytochrome c554 and c-prime